MAERGTPEPAIVHRFTRGLLVFKLSDTFTLRFTQRAGNIRVLDNRYERRKPWKLCAQCDALLVTAPVLQADIDVHTTRIAFSRNLIC